MKQKISHFIDHWKLYQERLAIYQKCQGQLAQISLKNAKARVYADIGDIYDGLNPNLAVVEYQVKDPDNESVAVMQNALTLCLNPNDVYWVWNNFLKQALFIKLSHITGSQGSKLHEGCIELVKVHQGKLHKINSYELKEAFLDKSKGG